MSNATGALIEWNVALGTQELVEHGAHGVRHVWLVPRESVSEAPSGTLVYVLTTFWGYEIYLWMVTNRLARDWWYRQQRATIFPRR